MSYKVADAADIPYTWDRFKLVRHHFGSTAFGINQIDLPANMVDKEHDEVESRQEEIYLCLTGGGTLTIDGEPVEMRPGRYILVSPEAKRQPAAGPDGVSMVVVGSVPGGAYEPWELPEE